MSMLRFVDGTPGTPATFNDVLGSLGPLLLNELVDAPRTKVVLGAGAPYSCTSATPASVIEAGAGSVITITSPAPERHAFVISGVDFTLDIDGDLNTYSNNVALVVGGPAGYRVINAGSVHLGQNDLALLSTINENSASADVLLESVGQVLDAEYVRTQRVGSFGSLDSYVLASELDDITSLSRPVFTLTGDSPVLSIVPVEMTQKYPLEVVFEIGNGVTDLQLALSLPDARPLQTYYSATVIISNFHAPSGSTVSFTLPTGVSWDTNASPLTLTGSNPFSTKLLPMFRVLVVGTTAYFVPHTNTRG